jgi:hypothetical protein
MMTAPGNFSPIIESKSKLPNSKQVKPTQEASDEALFELSL